MSIDLLQLARQQCLSLLLLASDIDNATRKTLDDKIIAVVSHALDPYIFGEVAQILRLDELADLPHDQAIRLLASRIFKCVLSNTPDLSARLARVLKRNLDQRTPHFIDEYDPAKEGRAKNYKLESEAALEGKPAAFLFCLSDEEITEDTLVEAFMNDFEILYLQIHDEGPFTRQMFAFLSECFTEALGETTQEVRNGTVAPARGLAHFFQCFYKRYPKSEYREMISRAIFRDLAGELVEGGIGPKTPLETRNFNIQVLIAAYETGSWKEDEERELVVIKQIPPYERPRFLYLLRSIANSAPFPSVMTQYFESLVV